MLRSRSRALAGAVTAGIATALLAAPGLAAPITVCGQTVRTLGTPPPVTFSLTKRYQSLLFARVGQELVGIAHAPCQRGVTLSFDADKGLAVTQRIRARDGSIAAVVLRIDRVGDYSVGSRRSEVLVGVALIGGWTLPTPPYPVAATEIPETVTGSGVNVNGQVVLTPLTSPPLAAMSADQVLEIARQQYAESKVWQSPPAMQLVTFTMPGGLRRIQNVPAWILTYTSDHPVDVNVGGPCCDPHPPPILVTHYTIALDAVSGKFLGGFFTR